MGNGEVLLELSMKAADSDADLQRFRDGVVRKIGVAAFRPPDRSKTDIARSLVRRRAGRACTARQGYVIILRLSARTASSFVKPARFATGRQGAVERVAGHRSARYPIIREPGRTR